MIGLILWAHMVTTNPNFVQRGVAIYTPGDGYRYSCVRLYRGARAYERKPCRFEWRKP